MKWTKRPPKQEGYYWLRRRGCRDRIVQLRWCSSVDHDDGKYTINGKKLIVGNIGSWEYPEVRHMMPARWKGPLQP